MGEAEKEAGELVTKAKQAKAEADARAERAEKAMAEARAEKEDTGVWR